MSFSVFSAARAIEPDLSACLATDTECMLTRTVMTAADIGEERWRDSTYRETAKIMVHEGRVEEAITMVDKIASPDTKAMTIRAIGTVAAEQDGWTPEQYDELFARLKAKTAEIEHEPSRAIALTYITMAQALAGDYDGAMQTAAAMDNDALRNKAYAETAEIQAEKGDLAAVKASLAAMDDPAFRDKAFRTVSKIFANNRKYEEALGAAENITIPYHRAQAYLYILGKQTMPEDVSIE